MAHFPDVRRARRDDQEQVGALWMAFLKAQTELDDRFAVADDALDRWNNDYPVWLTNETQRIFVVEPGDTIQGFATAHRWGPPPIYEESSEIYIDELYVVPDARRRGLGTQLVRAVRHWAESLSANRLRLQMMATNEAARAFWAQQEARPFTTTMTIELAPRSSEDEPARGIGF